MLCHGDDGKLGLSGSKDLTASTLSREDKINIITNGKNAMQPYNEMLTANQIIAVTNYIETLK
nr:cytochrome c [Bacteroidota bacterium]